jgi:hypothetical protein
MDMKPTLRWLLLLPIALFGFLASWLVYPVGSKIAMSNCPESLRHPAVLGTISRLDALTLNSQFCRATWYPPTIHALFISAIVLSIAVAGILGFCVAPTRKRLIALLSVILAAGIHAAINLYVFESVS